MTCRTKLLSLAKLFGAKLFGASLLGLMAQPALAGQHCVTCSAPAATYLCEAQNGPGILAANGGQLACITQLAKRGGHDSCSVIKRAAAQCDGLAPTVLFPGTGDADINAAETSPSAPPISGDRSTPTADAPDDVAMPIPDTFTPAEGDPAAQAEDTEEAAEDAPKGPPKTVAEMAGRALEGSKKGLGKAGKAVGDTAKSAGNAVTDTAKKTGEQIGKAGKAVGNAASKTWNCVTSLFSDC